MLVALSARFMGLVHHTDAEREYAYDRDSKFGRLDKALDEANARGWTVVDMKTDWNTILSSRRSLRTSANGSQLRKSATGTKRTLSTARVTFEPCNRPSVLCPSAILIQRKVSCTAPIKRKVFCTTPII
jgi:hypothetical protein